MINVIFIHYWVMIYLGYFIGLIIDDGQIYKYYLSIHINLNLSFRSFIKINLYIEDYFYLYIQ